jgi:hypothetical protein
MGRAVVFCGDIFLTWCEGVFTGDFSISTGFLRGFWWSIRGRYVHFRGFQMDIFRRRKIRHFLKIYFLAVSGTSDGG